MLGYQVQKDVLFQKNRIFPKIDANRTRDHKHAEILIENISTISILRSTNPISTYTPSCSVTMSCLSPSTIVSDPEPHGPALSGTFHLSLHLTTLYLFKDHLLASHSKLTLFSIHFSGPSFTGCLLLILKC